MRRVGIAVFLIALAAACTRNSSQGPLPGNVPAAAPARLHGTPIPIQHIIFIVQENRTFDNIFGGPSPLPGAYTVSSGETTGTPVPLQPLHLGGGQDPDNYHAQWYTACNPVTPTPFPIGGQSPCRMNGFNINTQPSPGFTPPARMSTIYSYVNYAQTAPYFSIAETYAAGDHFFMGHNSESYTAHQYIFSGQSNNVVDYPVYPSSTSCSVLFDYCVYTPWGCDAPQGTSTYTINPDTGVVSAKPSGPLACFGPGAPGANVKYPALASLVQAKGLTWRLYAFSLCNNINALDVNWSIRNSSVWPAKPVMANCHTREGVFFHTKVDTPNFRMPQTTFLSDINDPKHPLANVTWILPGPITSDHPGVPLGECGPAWVASIINAVGKSKYWSTTAIFVFWDDWGGFYDHVPPYVVRDQQGPGFRVPLLVVSPYVKRGYVSHTNTEFATLLKFAENTFNLGSLGATDATPYLNNLNDYFGTTAQPFTPIPLAAYLKKYSLCNPDLEKNVVDKNSRWLRMIDDD